MKKNIRSIVVGRATIFLTIFIGQFAFAQEENSTMLETGVGFRNHLVELAGGSANIEKIIKSAEPLNCLESLCSVISAEGEAKEVSAMYSGSNKTIYYYTDADKIYLNPSSSEMFSMLTGLTEVDMTQFDTSKVTDMSNMFNQCKKLTSLNLSSFDTSNVTNMNRMFNVCSSLTTLNVSNFNTKKVINMGSMFNGCSKLTNLNASGLVSSSVEDVSNMFKGCSKLTSLNLSNFDTSNVTDMSNMFNGCSKLTSLNLSKFDTSNVTDMSNMFNGCNGLTNLNISGFTTNNVTDMNNMFRGCSKLTTLDVSSFVTNNVTDMNNMFRGCSSLTTLDVSSFVTNNVTNMSSMFNGYKGTSLDVSNFDTSNVTDMNGMFNGCTNLTTLDVSKFDTSKVTDMNNMFRDCKLPNLDVSKFDTSKVTDVHEMFHGCTQIEELDLTSFNTNSVINMNDMFNGCSKLTTIYASDSFVLGNTTSSTYMFYKDNNLVGGNGTQYTGTHVTGSYAVIDNEEHKGYFSVKDKESIFLPGEKFNAKIKSLANGINMTFNDIDNNIKSIIRSNNIPQGVDTEIVSIMGAKNPIYVRYEDGIMYYYTESEKVYMNPDSKSMFQGCSNLTDLNLEGMDTSKVTKMNNMFQGCSSLTGLDLSRWNTSNVTNIQAMFNSCSSLKTLDLENFDTRNITTMRTVFYNCESLEILNLESFDTSNVENMNQMFFNAKNLKTIYVSDKFVTTALSGNKSSQNMFSGDVNLVGGNGTIYDSSIVESGYARIDKEGQPGYFTDILDREYEIIYNLDGGTISGARTGYTQKDTFTLPSPTKEGYNFVGWTGSNLGDLEIEVTIPENTKGNLEYTANREKIEEPEKNSDNKYSGGGGSVGRISKNSQSTENNGAGTNEEKQNEGESTQGNNTTHNSDYLLEQNEAYQFAYNNGITTMPTIAEADMEGGLTRIAMAKMLSNYAINVLGKNPANKVVPKFPDITDKLNEDYGGAVDLSYQLGIMGINIDKFRPFDKVTRGEFATALSRMLFGTTDGENIYYEPHIKKLFEEKIISVTDPKMQELRGYVMIMLMRSAKQ